LPVLAAAPPSSIFFFFFKPPPPSFFFFDAPAEPVLFPRSSTRSSASPLSFVAARMRSVRLTNFSAMV
jgi:hypothetical protein